MPLANIPSIRVKKEFDSSFSKGSFVRGNVHTMALKAPRKAFAKLLAATLLCVLPSCVQTRVPMSVDASARTTALRGIHHVAVIPLDGAGASDAAARLETMIAEAHARSAPGTVPAPKLVDRHAIDRIRTEFNLAKNKEVSKATAVNSGKILGADALLLLRVTSLKTAKHFDKHQEPTCAAYSESKGFIKIKKCTKWDKKDVTCTTTTGTLEVQPRLIRSETGEIILARPQVGEVQFKHCDNTGEAPNEDTLRSIAVFNAATEIGRDLVAHRYEVNAAFKQAPDGLSTELRERFNGALQFARAQRFDRACAIFQDIWAQQPNSLAVRYNLALCKEKDGTVTEAFAMIDSIDRDLTSPDKDVNETRERLLYRINQKGGNALSSRR